MKKLLLILTALAVWGAMEEGTPPVKPVEVMAVYYPLWHVYPRGEEWFGQGWTEWEFVKTAKTRFPGQKIFKPYMGYLDGKDPDDVAVEIDLASNCGIDKLDPLDPHGRYEADADWSKKRFQFSYQ